jgi:hypothetical protein
MGSSSSDSVKHYRCKHGTHLGVSEVGVLYDSRVEVVLRVGRRGRVRTKGISIEEDLAGGLTIWWVAFPSAGFAEAWHHRSSVPIAPEDLEENYPPEEHSFMSGSSFLLPLLRSHVLPGMSLYPDEPLYLSFPCSQDPGGTRSGPARTHSLSWRTKPKSLRGGEDQMRKQDEELRDGRTTRNRCPNRGSPPPGRPDR